MCESLLARIEANGGAYIEQARLDSSGKILGDLLCMPWCGGFDKTGGRESMRQDRMRDMKRLQEELRRKRNRATGEEL